MANLLSIIAAPRRTNRQSLLAATYFAVQVAIVALLLSAAYDYVGKRGATWAIISAVLVLYPGIGQSVSAALVRIAANLLGAIVGGVIGYRFGTDILHIVLALIVVIYLGELMRIDLALRTACVAAIIVMTAGSNGSDQSIRLLAIERVIAVVIGCGAALVMQTLCTPISRRLTFIPHTERNVPRTETGGG